MDARGTRSKPINPLPDVWWRKPPEVLEAIDTENTELLREELGDLLLQVVFHAQIEEEAGRFDLEDVAREISEKLDPQASPCFWRSPMTRKQMQMRLLTAGKKIKAEEKKAREEDDTINYLKNYLHRLPATLQCG